MYIYTHTHNGIHIYRYTMEYMYICIYIYTQWNTAVEMNELKQQINCRFNIVKVKWKIENTHSDHTLVKKLYFGKYKNSFRIYKYH